MSEAAVELSVSRAAPTLHEPTRGRAARWYERLIETGLAGCGLTSIAITIGIVVILVHESEPFFAHVSLSEFLGSRKWTPIIGGHPSYGVWPLLSATLTTAAIALAVAVPLGLLSAIYLSEYAHPRTRRVVKPALELLAGVPTIVFGYFAITTLTPTLRDWVPNLAGGNMLSAGLMMGIMIVPLVASLSEDAIYAVPQSLREAAAGLGAGPFEAIRKVIVPSAWSGIAAAITLAASRAIGETMIVAIAAGNEARFGFDPRQPGQTATAYIVDISKGETPHGSIAYQTIFAVAAMLFVMTLIMNLVSFRLSRRLRASARA